MHAHGSQGISLYERYAAYLPLSSEAYVSHMMLFTSVSELWSMLLQTVDATPGYMNKLMAVDHVKLAYPGQRLKFVMILREPVSRTYSMYEMAHRAHFKQVCPHIAPSLTYSYCARGRACQTNCTAAVDAGVAQPVQDVRCACHPRARRIRCLLQHNPRHFALLQVRVTALH